MSDILENWMKEYLRGCQKGIPAHKLMADIGVDLPTFENARRDNAAFSQALECIVAGVGQEPISADGILRLLRAQVSDDRIAAYFGLKETEMLEKIKTDPELLRVYETGRLKGKAELQVAQFEAALSGNTKMLEHQGTHVLGQDNTQKVEIVDISHLGALAKAVRDKLEAEDPERFKSLESRWNKSKIIDIEETEENTTEGEENV